MMGYIEAGPHLNGTMKDMIPAPPEVSPASKEDPTPEVDPALEDSPTGETGDPIQYRKRRGITFESKVDEHYCKKHCKKNKSYFKTEIECLKACKKFSHYIVP